MRRALATVGKWAVLLVTHAALFTLGSVLFPVKTEVTLSPEEAAAAGGAMLLMSAIDSALVLALVRTSRLRGLPLVALVSGVFYFVKTATSQLEAVYFMPNVSLPMLPALLMMTVPVSLGLPLVAAALERRLRSSGDDERAWLPLAMGRRELWLKVLVLSAVVYPVLFFGAGWFIAFRSEALKAFYGGAHGETAFAHFAWLVSHDPFVYVLEVVRGALWVGCALVLLRTTRGPWWVGALQVALWFSLVQNDVHLLPNPLMAEEIRLYHFIETGSSNFIFAWCIGFLLHRSHLSKNADVLPLKLRTRAIGPVVAHKMRAFMKKAAFVLVLASTMGIVACGAPDYSSGTGGGNGSTGGGSGATGGGSGNGSTGQFGCESNLGGVKSCYDVDWSGGVYTPVCGAATKVSACSHSGAVGGCKVGTSVGAVSLKTTTWYYMGTTSTVQSACSAASGTFISP